MFHSLKISLFKDQGRARLNKPPSPQQLAHMRSPKGEQKVSGGYIGGVPPVPIPNTEVKPSRADGTARFPCGRVGRCRNFSQNAPPSELHAPTAGHSSFSDQPPSTPSTPRTSSLVGAKATRLLPAPQLPTPKPWRAWRAWRLI